MRATAETVEGNKVRLSVEVDEPEVDRALDDVVRTLARQVRVPGFRPGKVPRRVLEARMGGAAALRAEALRETLPDFYARALTDTWTDPIASPEIDVTGGEESGAVTFDAVVEVRPEVSVAGYGGLEVTVPSPVVTDADVDAQVDRLRETEAELEEVERPAVDGDMVTIDVHGTRDDAEVTSTEDYLYEVGSGRIVPELDDALRGAEVGAILQFSADGPDGAPVTFRVLVKAVQAKRLPVADDDWAAESSEFSTIEELRADLRARIGQVKLVQSQLALRQGAGAALAELVAVEEVPQVLVDQEVRERLEDLGRRLEGQGISAEQFLQVTGRTPEDLVGEVRQEAVAAVRLDLALRALADAESIDVTEEELDAEVARNAQELSMDPKELRTRLDHAGRTTALRSERRKAKALSWLLEHVTVVDEDGAPVDRTALDAADGEGNTAPAPAPAQEESGE